MPPELKDRLQNAADLNGRSLNLELVHRLRLSFEPPPQLLLHGEEMRERTADYIVPLTGPENSMLAVFRRMPPEKQLALISLFK